MQVSKTAPNAFKTTQKLHKNKACATGSEDGNRGDLDHPHLKDYPGCDPKSESCQLSVSSSSDTAKTEVDDSDLEDMSAEELRRMGIVDSFPVE